MTKRKTIDVNKVKEIANSMLATKSNVDMFNGKDVWPPEAREGVSRLLDAILHESGNYNGFNYVYWINEGGFEQWRSDGQPDNNRPYLGDQTRKVYY
jgi:hypothetical protein